MNTPATKIETASMTVPKGDQVLRTLTSTANVSDARGILNQAHRDHIITYWLVAPDKTHTSFAIKWRKKNLDGRPLGHGTFKDERVALLNKLFKANKKTHRQTEAEFKALLQEIQKKERQLRGELEVLAENDLLLETYIKKRYSQNIAKRKNKDIRTPINEAKRAILAVGKVSLISGDAGMVMDAILNFSEDKNNQFNRYIGRVRGILKANDLHGKADELTTLREPPNEVTYITYMQLSELVDHIRKSGRTEIGKVSVDTFIALIQFLFWSGLRIGEAAAINASYMDLDAGILSVKWQIDDNGQKRPPKYEKQRKTHVSKQGLPFFTAWIKASDRDRLDRKQATKILKKFCKEIFPDPINHISLHGLRHSYAHVMLRHFAGLNGKRFTLDDVADFLGDHPWTAKKFYAGMIPDKIAFERAKEITDNELIA